MGEGAVHRTQPSDAAAAVVKGRVLLSPKELWFLIKEQNVCQSESNSTDKAKHAEDVRPDSPWPSYFPYLIETEIPGVLWRQNTKISFPVPKSGREGIQDKNVHHSEFPRYANPKVGPDLYQLGMLPCVDNRVYILRDFVQLLSTGLSCNFEYYQVVWGSGPRESQSM